MKQPSAPGIALGLSLLMSFHAFAATLATGTADVGPGDAGVQVPLTLTLETGDHVSGLQFDLLCEERVALLTAMQAGPVATAAGKSVSFNRIQAGRYRAIVAGLNQNLMASGVTVIASFDVASRPPNGEQPLQLEGLVMSDPSGHAVPSTAIAGVLHVTGGVPDDEEPPCGCASAAGQGPHAPPPDAVLAGVLTCAAALFWCSRARVARGVRFH